MSRRLQEEEEEEAHTGFDQLLLLLLQLLVSRAFKANHDELDRGRNAKVVLRDFCDSKPAAGV
jgi:hypothetical protein